MRTLLSGSSSEIFEHQRAFNSTRIQGYNPKLEFPKFNGMNTRMWILKSAISTLVCVKSLGTESRFSMPLKRKKSRKLDV